MAVYVDPLFNTEGLSGNWSYDRACHMTADSHEELMAFAARLGLKPAWLQKRGIIGYEHFDLTAGKRKAAVRLGAKEITVREAVDMARKAREGLLAVEEAGG